MNIKHLFSKPVLSMGLVIGLISPAVTFAVDTDGDGISDSFEVTHGFDASDINDFPVITLLNKYSFTGESQSDFFGQSVSSAGDVNKDGINDVIVGARADDFNGDASGAAYIYSGANGQELYRIDGDAAGDQLGFSVAEAGDINKDGYADVIVGAPFESEGYARVISGIDGSILYTFDGPGYGYRFGHSVSAAGDVNNDTYPDVIVGSDKNIAIIYSGIDGAVLYSLSGEEASDKFGYSVTGIGDINNDNHDDVIVGAHLHKRMWAGETAAAGSSYLISGIDGSMSLVGVGVTGDRYAWDVNSAGDVNDDNVPDYIVGAPYDDSYVTNSNRGAAFVISGADHSKLYTFYGTVNGENLASTVDGSGDINGDGYQDIIVGSPYQNHFQIFSGKDGSLLFKASGVNGSTNFAVDVADIGDINNDGYADIIIGENLINNATGAAHVYIASVDTDLDGISDDVDTDDDGDGLSDAEEATHSTNDKVADTDGDGINDGNEVKTYTTNPLLSDSDSDGVSDGLEVNTYNTDPNSNDSDNDGLTDGEEINNHHTLPNDPDSDSDGLSDAAEVNTHLTNPLAADSDSDGVSDGLEVNTYSSDPLDNDSDNDGLTDGQEVNNYGSNPTTTDSDLDTLSDYDEVNSHNTNPALADSDSDGLADNLEINTHNTNPIVADSDDDGLSDGAELDTHSTNPLVADSDSDGVIDGVEITNGSNPNNTDTDNDGLTDGQEVNIHGTSSILADTDNDGLSDLLEINTHGTNPLLADSDGDGLTDNDELSTHSTSPLKMDSDGNGFNDSIEVNGQENIAPNWLVSNSDISFDTQINIQRPANIKKVLSADFNLDGLPDLIYAASDSISLAYQNIDHSFGTPIVLSTGNVDQWVVSDIDGDSDLDIYYAETNTLRVLINNGVHGFALQQSSEHMGYTPHQLIAKDFDASRAGDELIWVQKNSSYKVIYNLDDDSIVKSSLTMARTNTVNASFVDLTNDGLLDQLMEFNGYTFWAENLGNDTYTPSNLIASNLRFNSYTLASPHFAAKLSSNDFNDVVYGNQRFVYLMKNNGNGQFADKEIIAEIANTGTIAQVQPADIDLDGDIDILVGATDAIYLVKNNGDDTFTLSEISPLVSGLNDLQVIDLNRDGALDFLSASVTDQKLSWYKNATNAASATKAIDHSELLTQVSLFASANDANNDVLQYTLSGVDSALFEYSAANGLSFKTAPTTASPADVGGNNIHDLVISANDGTVSTALTLQITVQADVLDSDNDGLTDSQEVALGTNPNLADSDSDGLSDGLEVNSHSTNPLLADTDFDGLSDGLEVNTHNTNPNLADSDNDGTNDGDEIAAGTNPNLNETTPDVDTDGDTLSDIAETNTHGTDINLIDTDADGVNDGDEVAVGTNPTVANTDYIISFEDGLLPAGLVVIDGSGAWATDDSSATHGRFSLKANTPANDQASVVRMSAVFATTQLVFNAKVSSETNADYLIITLDGSQELLRLSGELDWQEYRLDIPAGSHTVDIAYTKDANLASGSDTAWIDHVRFTVNMNAATVDSDNDLLTDIQEQSIGTDPNNIDSDFDGVNDADEIIVGTDPTLIEMHKIIGYEDGLKPRGTVEDFNATTDWATDSTTASVGNFSFKAKAINNGENAQAAFWANFAGGAVTFDFKVSTQLGSNGHDDPNALEALAIFLDGTPVWIVSGEHDWLSSSINVPAGLHSVAFVYFKKANINSGSDTVWIDNVQFDIAEYGANADMDQDGLYDRLEVENGGIIWVADTDKDGLSDGLEVNTYLTNPALADTDNDGINDGDEVNQGTDPRVNNSSNPTPDPDPSPDPDGTPDNETCTADCKLNASSGGGGRFGIYFLMTLLLLAYRRKTQI